MSSRSVSVLRRVAFPALLALSCGCAANSRTVSAGPGASFCLLATAEGKVGTVVVSNAKGQQVLSEANHEVTVANPLAAPGAPRPLSEAQVAEVYGTALGALPPPPAHFILYFDKATTELSQRSKPLVEEVLRAVQERPGADISIIGHTDSTGDRASNVSLGLRRAQSVAGLLAARGLNVSEAQVASHGQDNPLVPTPPNTDEPVNRRVEVTVR